MAKLRYIGTSDPTDSDVCEVFGATFAKGKAVTVDNSIGDRLAGNPTFEIVTAPDPAPAPAAPVAQPAAATAAASA